MTVNLIINNKTVNVDVKVDEMLVDTLKNLGYTSVRRGCDTLCCGICTILLNNKAVLSCSIITQRVKEQNITTLEGIEEESSKLGDFLLNEGSDQCGYCAPAFILAVTGMLKEINDPTDEDINNYLSGNLCRCSGYKGQMRAIKNYISYIKGNKNA